MNSQDDFKNYLHHQQYSDSTVQGHLDNIRRVEAWKKENDFLNEALTYNELLSYVSYLQSKKLKPQTINIILQSITVYYEYLKEYNYITSNPAKSIRVKGKAKTVIANVLSYEELQNLYQAYLQIRKEKNPIHRSEKQKQYSLHKSSVLVGLMVYQGLNTSELGQLQIKDVDLDKGVIYLNGSKRINARILKLEAPQIVPLSNYLALLNPAQEKLFKEHIGSTVFGILQELKGINPIIDSANHIRASVIINWLKLHGKRKTQYLAGHKYVSSTEQYEVQNIDELTDLLKKHHPFG